MVRRTGMFEAPSNIITPQRIESPIGDTSATWEALGNAARALDNALEPARRQYAVEQAQRDASEGRYGLRPTLTEADALYNNAMTQSYLAAMERDVDTRIGELETEFAVDAEGFAQAFEGVRTGFMSDAPGDLAPHLEQFLREREGDTVRRIGERRRNIAIQQFSQNVNARLAQQEARLTGYDDINSEEFQREWRNYVQMGEAASANPLSGIGADEWAYRQNNFYSRLSAQQVANQAVLMYEEGGANADAASRAISFVEESMRNPELVLTEAQRDASFNEARRTIMRLESERRAREREIQREIRYRQAMIAPMARDMMTGAQAAAQQMVVIPDDQMAELGNVVRESGNAALQRQFNELQITNGVRNRLQGLTLAQMDGEIASMRERAQEGDLDAATELRAARAYRDAISRADGVTGLQLHFGEEPASLEQGFGSRFIQMEDYAERAGRREVQYFSPGEREQLAAALQNSDNPSDILRVVVADAMREGGNGRLRARRALSEVAGNAGPEYAAIGDVILRGGEASARTARNMELALRARRSEGFNAAALRPSGRERREDQEIIENVLGELNLQAILPEELAQIRLAADLIYEGRAINNPGVYEDETRYEREYRGAVQSALGAVTRDYRGRPYAYGGAATTGRVVESVRGNQTFRAEHSVVIPNWIRRDRFASLMGSLQLGDYAEAGGGRTPSQGLVSDWRNARLLPTQSGVPGEYHLATSDGAIYMTGVGPNRRPYVLDLNRLRASLAERQPDAIAP